MPLTADDLRPLLAKLTIQERFRLARLALASAGTARENGDAAAYRLVPPGPDEFATSEPDPMVWESNGWEEFQ